MNRLIVIFIVALSFVLGTCNVHAIDTAKVGVESIRVTNWSVTMQIEGNNNGCGGNKVLFSNNLPHIQNILSVALAAQAAGKKVVVRYVECDNSPWPNTARSSDLTIY